MADGRKVWRPRKPLPPEGSSPSPPNQARKVKTVQVWGREQMGLVSNPDTCWLPIQRDAGGSGVQVWDRRRLDMNSDPGLVWYPIHATCSPTTPCRPPPPHTHTLVHQTLNSVHLLPPPAPQVLLRSLWATSVSLQPVLLLPHIWGVLLVLLVDLLSGRHHLQVSARDQRGSRR
ncbi:hypothetical protein HanIR_Chr01g0031221 [Helianthus annuus]|nr:hypothetical protein HanIR_Chr01g0031221 [Helianthus annuus]